MRVHVLAIGRRTPTWIAEGVKEYCARMPRECLVEFNLISTAERSRKTNPNSIKKLEEQKLLQATPKCAVKVALDDKGKIWSTAELSIKMSEWMQLGQDICIYIGGPNGLANGILSHVDHRWSLSNLTLPHTLVRIIVAEQLYRAWTILSGHPYHRN